MCNVSVMNYWTTVSCKCYAFYDGVTHFLTREKISMQAWEQKFYFSLLPFLFFRLVIEVMLILKKSHESRPFDAILTHLTQFFSANHYQFLFSNLYQDSMPIENVGRFEENDWRHKRFRKLTTYRTTSVSAHAYY